MSSAVAVTRSSVSRPAAAIMLALVATAARAEVVVPDYVFDNGSTSYAYGSEVAGFQEADDFWFTSPCYVTGARFWTMEGYGHRSGGIPFDGHLSYWVYSSLDGQPGDVLCAGEARAFSRQPTGRGWPDLDGYQYTFDLLTPFRVQPNQHYFLALHLLSYYPDPNGEIYWVTADGPIRGAPSYRRDGGIGGWIDNSKGVGGVYGAGHLAFQVYANSVPEPSTFALLGMGAAGLLAYAGRRRKA